MTERLRVALVGGPMYDHLTAAIDPSEVDVVVHEDHPTLNARVADLLAAGERLDLISTHSKYAPSQRHWLQPLDDLVAPAVVDALAAGAVSLCRYQGALLSLPRLIDVRILWVRTDRVTAVPDTFDELLSSSVRFGFPGRESGLFGTFYELVVGRGGRLFDDHGGHSLDEAACVHAIEQLCALATRVSGLDQWHYDEVDAALLDGRVDAAGAWPGAWSAIAASPLSGVLAPFPYPAGPARRVSYAGCHSWAIPVTCGDHGAALQLLERLGGPSLQAVDAAAGSMIAHEETLARVVPRNAVDVERLRVTRETIRESMITYPPHENWPAFETVGWQSIQQALRQEISPVAAFRAIDVAAHRLLTVD